jgi:D-beta-D-heptose 7-phosphate kinase/D-beta-D-heptose 1-phosphate adenosyltransferase
MKKILLLGDVCRDIYHYGVCERLSPEAPVPIIDYQYTTEVSGMSYNVYRNLKVFGNDIDFFHGPMSRKERYIDIRSGQQIFRMDVKSAEDQNSIVGINFLKKYDAVVISDYDKGFVTENIVKKIKDTWNDIPIFVDSKKKNLEVYKDCIIKINESEYKNSTGYEFARELIVTLGANGARRKDKKYPSEKVNVHDVTGAGDVFLSVLASVYLDTNDLDYSIECAVKLSTESVKHFGSYTLKKEELYAHINYWT